MEEVWRDIIGWENLYQVSNYGNVRAKKRIVITSRHVRVLQGHLMRIHINRKGYCHVSLTAQGRKAETKRVHRLVAIAFIPNPLNLQQVNHKDENKQNNFVFVNPDGSIDPEKSNLEWCDGVYNQNYGTIKERKRRTIQQKYGGSPFKKPVYQFSLDGKLIKKYPSAKDAELKTGIKWYKIKHCCYHPIKSISGFIWVYEKDIKKINL